MWQFIKLSKSDEFSPIHYVAINKTIYIYYLNKSHDSLNKSCKRTSEWFYDALG